MFNRASGPSPSACLTLRETNTTTRACRGRGLDTNEKRSASGRTPVVRRLVGKGVLRVGPLGRFYAEQAALPFPESWPGYRLNGADPLLRRLLQPEVKTTLRRARSALLEEP